MAEISRSHRHQLPGRSARGSERPCWSTSGRRGAARAASIAPALRGDRRERDDLRIVKLNVDDNQQTAAQYQVLAIPTMILFRNGQEAKRIQGAMPKKRIEAELEPALAA